MNVDLWDARGRLSRVVWCRTRAAARRYVSEAADDEVQARIAWGAGEVVLVRSGIGEPWTVAVRRERAAETQEEAPAGA